MGKYCSICTRTFIVPLAGTVVYMALPWSRPVERVVCPLCTAHKSPPSDGHLPVS